MAFIARLPVPADAPLSGDQVVFRQGIPRTGRLRAMRSRAPTTRSGDAIRPSMHSEYMVRKESAASSTASVVSGRRRSLSSDTDSFKVRSSVPLLYASTISSMSTLSSSFYQYDSTGGAVTALEMDALADTPSSMGSGSHHHRKASPQDPALRLPPAQERAIRADAARMTRELVAEQLQALNTLQSRHAFAGGLHSAPIGNEVATAKGVRVFEKPGLGGGAKKHAAKRYTAHWQVHATVDEVLELLVRDDRDVDKYATCQAALHPETVNSKLLWRGGPQTQPAAKARTRSGRSVSTVGDELDERGVLTLDVDGSVARDAIRRGDAGTHRRDRRRRRAADWMGINWWVQHMPHKLSRDRDFIVLEKQTEFESRSGPRPRRGFVHLVHSVDLADVSSVEKRLVSPFVRGLVIQSGLVVVESDEPGVLDVANTLEMDCAGHLSAGQQRQLVVKRLVQVDTLGELLWKTRLLKSQRLQWRPRLEKSSDGHANKCDRCKTKASRFSRRVLEPCRACERVVCSNCSQLWEFAPALVAAASPHRQLPMDVDHDGVLKARVCAHCVTDHSKARPQRHQSMLDANTLPSKSFEYEDDDEGNERNGGDVISHKVLPSYHSRHNHFPKQLKLSRQSSAPVARPQEWNPSRSSRVAESLVDSFLMSMSPGASVLPKSDSSFSPSTLSEDAEPAKFLDSESDHEPEHDTVIQQPEPVPQPAPRPAQATLPQRRESRAYSMRRPSTASYTPLQGYDQPPRKRSIFESIPEPAPRKNVVLYEG